MSLNQTNISNSTNSSVSVIELYWNLVAKADKKFSKIRDLPYYQRTRYDTYFYKVFKVYTQLWKFQQENRQKLVEAGLKRWEIGDIASRIGQLYFGQYMRTSEASYLSESYIFYEAILTREYFKEGLYQDINLVNKQLRFLARFLTVCLVLNRREVVYQLVNQLKKLLDECKRTFQKGTLLKGLILKAKMKKNLYAVFAKIPFHHYLFSIKSSLISSETDFKEWKLVIQEIVKFLKADTAFMNIRPLRYSVVLDLQPNSLPHIDAPRKLKLRDALLCSYHPNEVKFSELALDTFRMVQCLEWEPSGLFYQTRTDASGGNGTNTSQNGTPGFNRVNQDITDPSLEPNPRKAVLYRPSVTHFMAVLGTVCEELAPDGILLIYLSASGSSAHIPSSPSCAPHSMAFSENIVRSFQFHSINNESTSAYPTSFGCESSDLHSGRSADCLHIGARGNGGMNCIYPCDFLPFTRRPLFLIIDSDSSKAFKAISGAEKGERISMLLSPSTSLLIPQIESSCQPTGSSFTSFLTAPLQSFILLLGFTGSDVEMDMYDKAEKLLYSSLNQWGSSLATSDNLDPVWAQILADPFLRRLLLRFVFVRAVLSMYIPSSGKIEFLPECVPCLPDIVSPTSVTCEASILQLADIFGARDKFVSSQDTIIHED